MGDSDSDYGLINRRKSKLTPEQVIEIRELLATGNFTQTEIAERYGVNRGTIGMIATRVSWQHLSGPKPAGPRRSGKDTGYLGVTTDEAGNRFYASIRDKGRQRAIGEFDDPIAAAKAYDERARELGLPPEKLNFPEES
jgi:hypothetical protein